MNYDLEAIGQEKLNELIDSLEYKKIKVFASEINRKSKANIVFGLDDVSIRYCENILDVIKKYGQSQMRIFNNNGFVYALVSSPVKDSKDIFYQMNESLKQKIENKESLEIYALKSAYEISKSYQDTDLSAVTFFKKKNIEKDKYDFIVYNPNNLEEKPQYKQFSSVELLNYYYDPERRKTR